MIKAISDCMTKSNVKFIRIDGATRNDLRTAYVDKFQQRKSCRVAILSLKACNAGITLTAASLVIFAELDWNPSVSLTHTISVVHRCQRRSIDQSFVSLSHGSQFLNSHRRWLRPRRERIV